MGGREAGCRTYQLTVPRQWNNRRTSTLSIRNTMAAMDNIETRKTWAAIINVVLLVSSLILIGTGASLMGFYRLQMLEVITLDFLIVPLVLTVGGVLTLLVSVFGILAVAREDPCLLLTYSIFISIDFLIILTGIISSVRLLFDIQVGFLNADVMPELSSYETDSWVRYKWDTIQREFTCCGGYGYAQGYTDWKHTSMGGARNSVPDSCCLFEAPGCGGDLFAVNDLRVIISKINVHGCLTVMQRRLDSHVTVILIVFSAIGGLLAVIELLGIVLACCLASSFSRDEEFDTDYGGRPGTPLRRPSQSQGGQLYSSSHESPCL